MSRVKTYGPARTDGLALVSLEETHRPFRAVWPVLIRQLLGGKRWSLSLIQYRTPKLEQAKVSETGVVTEGLPVTYSMSEIRMAIQSVSSVVDVVTRNKVIEAIRNYKH